MKHISNTFSYTRKTNQRQPYHRYYTGYHKQQVYLALQQVRLYKAVKQLIDGNYDKVSLIDSTPHHEPIESNRAYLNPEHPFYTLLEAYNDFDEDYFYSTMGIRLSPYVQLLLMCDGLINIREQVELDSHRGQLTINALALQDIFWLIEALYMNSQSPSFRSILSQYYHDTGYTDHLRQYSRYIEELFDHYRRVLVIRLDLGYKEYISDNRCCYAAFRADMDYFINLIPSNPVFKDLIGYIWKLEYGTDKGYHAHLLLCYDGSKRRSDYHIAKQVGELWQHNITLGRGLYFNCNTKEQKANYKHCYLGMVHRDDENKINWMIEYGVSYLLKTDEYMRLMKPDNRRILGRGVIKAKNK
ncbi:hypothetical protein DKL61_02605 [Gammaproteobacteria bacterium ESL0073]|nr:hypothetical protein DKL61_02605 [Gammaproteobacteria bacterium ESL0073]